MNDASTTPSSRRLMVRLALTVLLLIVIAISLVTLFGQAEADVAFFLHAYRTDRIESSGVTSRPQLALINNSDRSVIVTNIVIEVKRGSRWEESDRVRPAQIIGMAPNGRWMVDAKLPSGSLTWRATALCRISPGRTGQFLNRLFFQLRVPFGFRGSTQTLTTQEYVL